ncbi:hypothetical protein EMIHUDRAFT_308528 [Emiliania huxleyi CCMP1516]|uniref:Uncharacterized protein n=2 Tax=Emiliania huxleyi TaxID=2903 RepID=A0A0D3J3Z3_EMIH1|nr:hypothetical protein EMIHUDRAFT_308528 [Emiliania huxleyi CCMP1516]EOD18228.1 hypothetical protein EMIHUDRAFT_308528 [Emiliania huxleyi CCMP1516]|eukprot:XP_005770657.1 hypothetical protein EMIHUDRAFT_308528 [Emiliania huxleyi CCMP1516]
MGWSQMCESYAIGAVSPRLWFAAASHESVQLARRLSARLGGALFGDEGMVAGGMVWPAHEAEPYVLTEELVGPAHDGITRAGASLRVLEGRCFGGGKVVASLPSPSSSRGAATDDVLTARAFLARPQVLSSGCGATPLAPPEEAMGEAGAERRRRRRPRWRLPHAPTGSLP